jgi:hypothetical protein
MKGAIPPVLHKSLWRAQGQRHLHYLTSLKNALKNLYLYAHNSGNNFIMKFIKQDVSFTVSLNMTAVTGCLEERMVSTS